MRLLEIPKPTNQFMFGATMEKALSLSGKARLAVRDSYSRISLLLTKQIRLLKDKE